MNIMYPKHERWEEFVNRLEGSEGCDFWEDEHGKISWTCKGGNDHTFAKKILVAMGEDIDVEESLQYFRDHGGHCDCEILFNVNPD